MGNFKEDINITGNPEKIKIMNVTEIKEYLLQLIANGNKFEFEQLYEHFQDDSCNKYDRALEYITSCKEIEWIDLCADATNDTAKYEFINMLPKVLLEDIEVELFQFGNVLPRHPMSKEEIENRARHAEAAKKLSNYMEKLKENTDDLSIDQSTQK